MFVELLVVFAPARSGVKDSYCPASYDVPTKHATRIRWIDNR